MQCESCWNRFVGFSNQTKEMRVISILAQKPSKLSDIDESYENIWMVIFLNESNQRPKKSQYTQHVQNSCSFHAAVIFS